MPEPLHPPYSVVQPRQLDRWLDVNSQNGPLTRIRGFIQLPPFNIASAGRTYSEIVGVFNYTAPNNFSIKNFKKITNNGSYSLCIAYADAELNVFRYMLVKGNFDRNLSYPPVYDGQLIKKNFRLEIWDGINGANCIENNGFEMQSTVLGNIDYRYGLDFALGGIPVICTSQNTTSQLQFYVPPPSDNINILSVWLENHAEQQYVVLLSGTQVDYWQGRGFGDVQYVSPGGYLLDESGRIITDGSGRRITIHI